MVQSARMRAVTGILMGLCPLAFLFATQRMLVKEEPFFTWYFCFAWWSYVLFMESFLHRRVGSSSLFADMQAFILRIPLSVTIWLVFEAFNFRLNNWHYIEIVKNINWRWFGYALSFGTVLPGIFVTHCFVEHMGFARDLRCTPLKNPGRFHTRFVLLGGALLLGPLLWPHGLFPCVWLGFIFLLEPFNYRYGGESLLADLERGSPQRIINLVVAGLWCGFLWEFWNFWAGSKWVYTVPVFGFLKVFEMPLLGFLGFPPFALECYVMSSFFCTILNRAKERHQPPRFKALCGALGVLTLLFWAAVFWGIDRFTVVTFLP